MVKIKGEIEISNYLFLFAIIGGWIFTLVSIYWSYQITKGENPALDWLFIRDVVEYWLTLYGLWGGIVIFAIGLGLFTILGLFGLIVQRKTREK